ncbi:hypothetical protein EKG40_08030 [Pseudomonas moorei]|nr:hypothetical protein EKG40_08030 [Pseudomonas moorei]
MSNLYSKLFQDFSLETTAKEAARFRLAGDLLPPATAVNIAFIGSETFADRLHAIQTLHECGAHPRPIISARRIETAESLNIFLAQATERSVNGIFLVGGDPSEPKGPFIDSVALMNSGILDTNNIKTVGVARYLEGHPRIAN